MCIVISLLAAPLLSFSLQWSCFFMVSMPQVIILTVSHTSDFFLLHGDADSLVDCLVSAVILSTMGMVSTHSEHSNYKPVLFEQLLKSKYIRYALLKSGGHPWVPATLTEDAMPPAFPVCEGWN